MNQRELLKNGAVALTAATKPLLAWLIQHGGAYLPAGQDVAELGWDPMARISKAL